MIDLDIAIREMLRRTGGDVLADLIVENRRVTRCEVGSDPPRVLFEHAEGMGLRRYDGRDVFHRHVPAVKDEALLDLFEGSPTDVPNAGPDRCQEVPDEPVDELLALAERCVARAGSTPDLRLEVALTRTEREVTVVTQGGEPLDERQEQVAISLSAVAARDKRVRQARRFHGGRTAADLEGDLDDLADAAIQAAQERLEGVEAPSGEMPVIFGPGSPAALIHEICGHGLEGDIAADPRSAYHGRVGERLAAIDFTLIDDPTGPEWAPVYDIDDEGTTAAPTVLIDEGVLRGYLHDRRSALNAGVEPNGHGRRLGYGHAPLPRMSTTFVASGPHPAAEIIADTERGLYVTSVSGGDTDFDSGRFTIRVSEGRVIERGQLGMPIRGAAISGIGPEVLGRIDRVGDDLRFQAHGHACNKLDQFPLTVSVGQPTLRISSMLVWGG
jgi:TldD protein